MTGERTPAFIDERTSFAACGKSGHGFPDHDRALSASRKMFILASLTFLAFACYRSSGESGDPDQGAPDEKDEGSGPDRADFDESPPDMGPDVPPDPAIDDAPAEAPAEVIEDDAGEDPPGDDWCDCPHPEWCWAHVGCLDGCCPACENGGALEFGSCYHTCEEYPETDCNVICPAYSCGTAFYLRPGCAELRGYGFCMGEFGLNSFWYRGALAARLVGDYPEPDCPPENPCCQTRLYELGFEVTECDAWGFIPLDTSEVPAAGWSCPGTNCGPGCNPPDGTTVEVHVRWYPDHLSRPEKFVLEEVCGVL